MDSSVAAYLPMRAPQFESLILRGLPHRVARWGPPTANPIVLLHGFLDCCETFQFLVDEFPANWSFVALDWRGFGDSGRNNGPYWFPDYLADLDALIAALAAQRPLRLVGHSMGGNVAALYAGVRPASVAAVVSLEGFGLPVTQASQAPARFAQWLDQLRQPLAQSRYDSFAQFAAALRKRNRRLSPERAAFIASAWCRARPDGGVELRGDPWHRLTNPYLYRRDESEACWSAYPGPVQMVLAEQSDFLRKLGDAGEIEAFLRVFRQPQVSTIHGVGHMMHHEDPAQVAAVIRPFLEQHQ
jgi:pimeloyl-ACP methyl ester carboxylesterase